MKKAHDPSHSRRHRSAQRDHRRLQRAACDALESRTLLCYSHISTLPEPPAWSDAIEQESRAAHPAEGGPEVIDIVWTNRGQASDNFAAAFGASAEAGRNVVDAAIAAWERVITNFNRSDNSITLQINISIARDEGGNLVGGFGGAGGPDATAPSDGKPRTGSITLTAGTIGGTPDDSNGWFFDPTPNDYSEFTGTILNPFTGNPASSVGGEFYSIAVAEMTHVLGLISPKVGQAGANFNGYGLVNSGFVQPTGLRDQAEGGGTFGHYYVFNGPSVSHAMTSFNSGDATDLSWGNVIHTAGGTANFTHNAVNYRGTDDDGNAASSGERNLPSWVTANILKDAYGYSIENPAKFGTMMAVLNSMTGLLTVRGIAGSADTISISSNGVTTTVSVDLGTDFPGSGFRPGAGNLDAWVSEFPTGSIQSILIEADSGDDHVILDLPGNIPIEVFGGTGNDQLTILGTTGYDNINVDWPVLTSSSLNVQNFSSFETLRILTRTGNADLFITDVLSTTTSVIVQADSGNETINLHTLDVGAPTVFFMGGGNDTVNVQVDPGVGLIKSPVTINGGAGNDVVNVGPVDGGSTIVNQTITFNGDGDDDSFVLGSNNADSIAATMVFNGGPGINDRVIFNDTAPSYNLSYDVQPTLTSRVDVQSYSVTHTSLDRVVINAGNGADTVRVRNNVAFTVEAYGNSGNDNFIVGDGNMGTPGIHVFNGGAGTDQITFDDRLNPGDIIWDFKPGEVYYGGLIMQGTAGFESVGVLAGTGDNEITFAGALTQGYNIDAGSGNDTIILGFNQSVSFAAPVVVDGGTGSDTFDIRAASTVSGGSVSLNGGASFNTMNVNRSGTLLYNIYSNSMLLQSFGSSLAFNYSNMEPVTVTGNTLAETFNVYSGSGTFFPFTINAGNGDDAFVLIPAADGQYSFNNLVLNGQQGTDSVNFAATALSNGHTVTLTSNTIRSNRAPLGDDVISYGTVEQVTLTGGSGDDTFNINQHSLGLSIRVNAGAGNDICNFGNNDVAGNISNIAAFLFDGEAGSDTFNLRNATPANAFAYNVLSNTTLQLSRPLPTSYTFALEYYNTEQKVIHAGPVADAMNMTAFASGEMTFNGAGGDDILNLPASSDLIGRKVSFFGGAGTNNRIVQAGNSKSAPTVLHVLENSIGDFPGDTFFAPGGSLYFDSVQNIQLRGGTGADTVYAQPNPIAAISIVGGNPVAAPGDEINLALAGVDNYLVNGSAASGSVTSSNRLPLTYSGFESGPNVDDAPPLVVVQDFGFNPLPARGVPPMAFTATFSEDISAILNGSFLELLNTTTNTPVDPADIAAEWDAGSLTATFTFPNFPGGLLPDGVYEARVLGGLLDAFGNPSAAGSYYTFIWCGGTSGDDSFRIALHPTTFDYEVYFNDDNVPAFLAGQGTAKIVLLGADGNDSMMLDLSGGDPGTPDGIDLFGGSGSDRLAVRGSSALDTILFSDSALTFNAALAAHQQFEQYSFNGGGGADALSIEAVRVRNESSQAFASLDIGVNGALELAHDADFAIVVSSLNIDPTGVLDLGRGGLVLDHDGNTPLTQVCDWLVSGRNGGTWDGKGITSSLAAITAQHAVGYGESSAVFGGSGGTFFTLPVDSTAVLVRYTRLGDADLNGTVNGLDFNRLAPHFGQSGTIWTQGNFNYDGFTNGIDFNLLAVNFGQSISPPAPPFTFGGPSGGGGDGGRGGIMRWGTGPGGAPLGGSSGSSSPAILTPLGFKTPSSPFGDEPIGFPTGAGGADSGVLN